MSCTALNPWLSSFPCYTGSLKAYRHVLQLHRKRQAEAQKLRDEAAAVAREKAEAKRAARLRVNGGTADLFGSDEEEEEEEGAAAAGVGVGAGVVDGVGEGAVDGVVGVAAAAGANGVAGAGGEAGAHGVPPRLLNNAAVLMYRWVWKVWAGKVWVGKCGVCGESCCRAV